MSLLLDTLARIEQTLSIEAAEYVPAIADVFTIIDQARKQHAREGSAAEGLRPKGATPEGQEPGGEATRPESPAGAQEGVPAEVLPRFALSPDNGLMYESARGPWVRYRDVATHPTPAQEAPDIQAAYRQMIASRSSAPAPQEAPQASEAKLLGGWRLNHVLAHSNGTAEIGFLDEDDCFARVITVDTGLYYRPDDAAPLAREILQALTATPQAPQAETPAGQVVDAWMGDGAFHAVIATPQAPQKPEAAAMAQENVPLTDRDINAIVMTVIRDSSILRVLKRELTPLEISDIRAVAVRAGRALLAAARPAVDPHARTVAWANAGKTWPWPVITRYTGGTAPEGVAGRVWLRLEDGGPDVEYVPAQSKGVVPLTDEAQVQHLLRLAKSFAEAVSLATDDDRFQTRTVAAFQALETLDAALRAALAATRAEPAEPVFWYRPWSDGLYEGPHHHKSVRGKMLREEKPGEWVPLYAAPQVARAEPAGGRVDEREATAAQTLQAHGVFKGAGGLQAFADADAFWEKQPYGTRFYFGDGIADYLHRDVLRAACAALTQPPTSEASRD